MFVCVCRGYREQDIRRAALAGLQSARDIYKQLGGEPDCGQCLEFAEELIRDVQAGSPARKESRLAQTA